MTDDSKNSLFLHQPGCDDSREALLDLSLTAEQRERVASALAHIAVCQDCQAAIADFDQISEAIGRADICMPENDWVNHAIQAGRIPGNHRHRRRAVAFLTAACLALVFVTVGYLFGRRDTPAEIAILPPPAPDSLPINSSDLADRVSVFEHVNQAFDNRAGWVLVSDNASDVGLDPGPSTDRGMLLLRLTVTRKDPRNANKKSIVSSADLAILPGRTAKLSMPFPQHRLLSYEISVGTGNPTALGLIAQLLPTRPASAAVKPIAALSTTLDLRPGEASPAGSFVTGSDGYELTIGFSKADLPAEPG